MPRPRSWLAGLREKTNFTDPCPAHPSPTCPRQGRVRPSTNGTCAGAHDGLGCGRPSRPSTWPGEGQRLAPRFTMRRNGWQLEAPACKNSLTGRLDPSEALHVPKLLCGVWSGDGSHPWEGGDRTRRQGRLGAAGRVRVLIRAPAPRAGCLLPGGSLSRCTRVVCVLFCRGVCHSSRKGFLENAKVALDSVPCMNLFRPVL